MGFPFDNATWEGVSGPIFMGAGGAMPGVYTFLAIAACIAVLAAGQINEASKYKGK